MEIINRLKLLCGEIDNLLELNSNARTPCIKTPFGIAPIMYVNNSEIEENVNNSEIGDHPNINSNQRISESQDVANGEEERIETGRFIKRNMFFAFFLPHGWRQSIIEENICEERDNYIRLKLYTEKNVYTISARWDNVQDNYLGCICQERSWRVGETFHSGCDLKDGAFSWQIANQIIKDIFKNEIIWNT